MTHDLYGKLAEIMIFFVCKRLGRCHYDTFACMDSQRVEVLHVADRDTVVITVADHLVFDLFPALERLLDKHLRRERESLFTNLFQFLLVVAEP